MTPTHLDYPGQAEVGREVWRGPCAAARPECNSSCDTTTTALGIRSAHAFVTYTHAFLFYAAERVQAITMFEWRTVQGLSRWTVQAHGLCSCDGSGDHESW